MVTASGQNSSQVVGQLHHHLQLMVSGHILCVCVCDSHQCVRAEFLIGGR